MRKLAWFSVGLLYFVLVWLNRDETFSSFSSDFLQGLREVSILLTLCIWSLCLALACGLSREIYPHVSAPKLRRLSGAGLGALVVQYFLGALSRNYHAALACPAFPGCSESGFLPLHFEGTLAFLHRWWGILMLGLFIHLSIAAVKTAPALLSPARKASGLGVAQVFLGIGIVMTQLHPNSRLYHVAVGYALWGLLVFIRSRTGGILTAEKLTA
jgi:heme A synthase